MNRTKLYKRILRQVLRDSVSIGFNEQGEGNVYPRRPPSGHAYAFSGSDPNRRDEAYDAPPFMSDGISSGLNCRT